MEKPDRLGIAVIGCGNIARSHLDAINHIDDLRLIATVDIYEDRAREYAAKYGAERCYTSYIEALEDPDVDAVSICLPHNLHAKVAIEAAQKGKHVLTEKPMATSLRDAEMMVEAAESKGVTLMVEQTLRFRECNIKARNLIREGVIGTPRHAVRRRLQYSRSPPVTWANKPEVAGGWVLYGFGSHEVDVTLWYLGSQPRRVYAQGSINNPYWNDYDEVSVHMELADGAIATVLMSINSQQSSWDCTIIGTDGSLTIREAKDITIGGEVIKTPLKPGGGIEAALREFASSVREGREPEASGRDVLRTMWTLEAAKASLRERRVISVKDLSYPV